MTPRLEFHPALTWPFRVAHGLWWRGRRAWRFGRWISRFDMCERDGIQLWTQRGLMDAEQEQHFESCRAAVTDLTAWFEVPSERPLHVFFFARGADAAGIFGQDATARALSEINGVVVARDHLQQFARPSEVMRHEIAHLLADRWGPSVTFNGEGLATWLETVDDSADGEALARLLGQRCVPITELLEARWWNDDLSYSYAIAGSFTGYLLRRFGKSAYREFYARAGAATLPTAFAEIFGRSLGDVEREWRADLLGRRALFEPALSRSIGLRRVQALFERWQFYQCLDELRSLRGAVAASPPALVFGARSHWYLGDFAGTVDLLEEALATDAGATAPSQRSGWWLLLGKARDLQGRRALALDAYRHALGEAAESDAETCREVQQWLKEPYHE